MKRTVLALTLVALGPSLPEAMASQPNVVLVMTDDQGYGDIGAHGNPWVRTPHLDELRTESVRFTQFHVDPTCTPTRAALMTGRYSTRTGCWHTILGRSLIFHDEVLMPSLFKKAGYTTGVFGKWHLGDNFPMRPQDRGFDQTVVHGGGGIGQTPDWWGNDYSDDTYWKNGAPKQFEGYCTDVFFDEAIRFVDANRSRPFFLYLPTNVAHSPYNVADEYSRPYLDLGLPKTQARFYGMIENLDENLGRLLAHLKSSGLEENTVFIFMTDNGTAEGIPWGDLQQTEWKGYNAGMRGKKGSQYDGGHRVPFFLRWPAGGLEGGRDISTLAAHIDVLPTLIDLCGLEEPSGVPMDGESLVPLLRGKGASWPDRTLFAHVQRQEIPPKWVRSTAMTQRWRLVDGKELYDIEKDPGQARDVAQEHPDVVRKLRADYEQWWASLQPAFSQYGYITIGADEHNPARITCHDWHSGDPVPWDQGHVRRDMWVNGYWMVEVAEAGEYEFTLRRQPTAAGHSLEATRARIRVGAVEEAAKVSPDATAVTLTLNLAKGPAKLETWLTDEDNGKTRGAFFVEVKRLD
jgi:arylsulfatase A-like enzyme